VIRCRWFRGTALDDQPWLETLEWVGNPPGPQATLRKGDERTVFTVAPDQIVTIDDKKQIEVLARFIELNDTTAKRLKTTTALLPLRDRAGLQALISELEGGPGWSVLTTVQYEDMIKALAGQSAST